MSILERESDILHFKIGFPFYTKPLKTQTASTAQQNESNKVLAEWKDFHSGRTSKPSLLQLLSTNDDWSDGELVSNSFYFLKPKGIKKAAKNNNKKKTLKFGYTSQNYLCFWLQG